MAVLYVVAARSAFLDERYRTDLGAAVRIAFVVIPLGTILLEEVTFRGVLWGLVRRGWGASWPRWCRRLSSESGTCCRRCVSTGSARSCGGVRG